MAGTIQHARSIGGVIDLAEATFGNISLSDEGWRERIARLRREFKICVFLARQRFSLLKTDLDEWRDQVRRGEVEFEPQRENEFKDALRAFTALAKLLIDNYDMSRKNGLYLARPSPINILEEHYKDVQKMLDSWQSPEWETTNERTAKWDKEQTRYLRGKLGSCN